jgi:RsiW-degrading membrane proteinase PrsW (M82 family)
MTVNYFLIISSFIVGIFAVKYLSTFDIHEKEPVFKMALVTLWGGIFSIGISLILYSSLLFLGIRAYHNLYGALFIIGPVEEAAKFFALLSSYLIIRHEVNEPTDGIIYMSCVALGFSLIENYFYALSSQYTGYIFIFRLLTSTPAHILFSVFMGIAFYSIIRLKTGIMLLLISYLYACVAHGLYDAILFHRLSFFFLVLLLLKSYRWALLLLSYTTAKSPFRNSLREFVTNFEHPIEETGYQCPNCGSKHNKMSYINGKIRIQKCDSCPSYLSTRETQYQIYKHFGSIFERRSNPYGISRSIKSLFSRMTKKSSPAKEKNILSFSLDELNATLIERNKEIIDKLEKKWWFPIKYDFQPKKPQDYFDEISGVSHSIFNKIVRWLAVTKIYWIPLLITLAAIAIVAIKLRTPENFMAFLFLGFPLVIIFFGIIYAIGLMIREK